MEFFTILAAVTTVVNCCYSIWQHQINKRYRAEDLARYNEEKLKREVAENELALIRSRGEAPYFSLSNQPYAQIYEQDGEQTYMWRWGANFLGVPRDEVEGLQKGDKVILLIENTGKDARNISFVSDLPNCELKQEPVFDHAAGRLFLKYDYDPEEHGKPTLFTLSFESDNGFQDTHVYETVHGKRAFKRIKPK